MKAATVPAQRIAHTHNRVLGQRGFDNYVYFDRAGNQLSHPPAALIFPILRRRVSPREVQAWLDWAWPVYYSRTLARAIPDASRNPRIKGS